MMAELNDKLIDYIYSFEAPADVDFFTDRQKQKLTTEELKLRKTDEYLRAVATSPQLGSKLEKDIAVGNIYSQGEVNRAETRQKALQGYGARIFPSISIITPNGAKVIMSRYCSDELGFLTDGYILDDELDSLLVVLKSEGVLNDELSKLQKAMDEHGAVIMQNGAMAPLFDLLQECVKYDITKERPHFATSQRPVTEQHGASIEALKKAAEAVVPKPPSREASDAFARDLQRELNERELRRPTPAELAPPMVPKPKFVAPSAKVPTPMPPRVAMPPKVMEAVAPKPVAKPMPAGPAITEIRDIEELKTISVPQLRQGDTRVQIDLIRSKILAVAQAQKKLPFFAVLSFEQSPLYKTYLSIGSMMILDPNPDRKAAFEMATRKYATTGNQPLTLQEFEAIADLRKQIEQF